MSSRAAPPSNQPMGQTTAAYGAKLREQIKAGTMTNAQAQAAHNANVKQDMAKRTAAGLANRDAQPMGKVTAAYGANLRDNIKAGTMTNAQAQAAHNAFAKQELARRTAPTPLAAVAAPSYEGPRTIPTNPFLTASSGPASGPPTTPAAAKPMKKGGKVSKPVKKMAKGGSTASSRGDGCAVRGKTKGTMR